MEISQIGVIGAGLMGGGIAQTAAAAGFQVWLYDADPQAVDSALRRIAERMVHDVRRGRLDAGEGDTLLHRIRPCDHLTDFAPLAYVVEAVTERIDVKKRIFAELDRICRPEAVLATNTSGLSITDIASATRRPDLVVGTHFFHPVPVMKLVEIVRGQDTSEDAVEMAVWLCTRLGKECIDVKEAPLFVVNRILVPMLNEAVFVLQEGLATAVDIDRGMTLGANHPIGPLALADMVGLDTLLLVADTLFQETGDSKYRPALLLRQMVRSGRLGRKSGRGFYTYGE